MISADWLLQAFSNHTQKWHSEKAVDNPCISKCPLPGHCLSPQIEWRQLFLPWSTD